LYFNIVQDGEQARKRLKVEDLGFEERNITVVGSATPVEDFRFPFNFVSVITDYLVVVSVRPLYLSWSDK
jgi:hypothetical protein